MGTPQRTYLRTHPWLTFQINLTRANARLWIALGEAQSKCEHIAGVPLRPSTADRLHSVFLAKGALATTAIEGNTLSEEEVLRHLEGNLHLPPSKDYLKQEIDNIVNSCNSVFGQLAGAAPKDLMLSEGLVCELNRLVLDGLTLEEGVIPGNVRRHEVTVARYHGAPARDCSYLLETLCNWLNGKDFQAPKGLEIIYGILKAVVAHLYLAWIHPFGDGNGRTARMVEFHILVAAGVPSPAAHLLSNHYNQTRQEYYRQLQYASSSGGDIIPFLEYAVQGFVDGLREQVNYIRDQQWNVAWRNYVHEESLGNPNDEEVRHRRRHLVLDLSMQSEPIPVSRIKLISPRVAEHYALKSAKTLTRDIDALVKEGLILKTPQGVVANKGLILAFLPARRLPSVYE